MLGQLGRWSGELDVVNDLLPLWAIPGLLAASVWLVLRPRPVAAIAALALLAAAADRFSADWRGPSLPALPAGGPGLRVVQFNAWKENADAAASVRWVLAQRADLVFLEEALPGSPVLAGLARKYPYRQSCSPPAGCSTLILSRVPPIASGGLAHGDPENRGALSAAWMRVPSRCGQVQAVVAHLSRPRPWPGADRDLNELAGALDRLGRSRTILAGDFNRTPWSFAMARQGARFGLARATHLVPTWPNRTAIGRALPPLLPLDHLYLSRDFASRSIRRGPEIGSDHRPVVADLVDLNCAARQPR